MDKAEKHEKKLAHANRKEVWGKCLIWAPPVWVMGTPSISRVRDQVGIENHFVIHLTSDLNAFSKNQMALKASSEN